MRDRIVLIAGAAYLLVTAHLLGCAKPIPLRIGFIGGLSGKIADLGVAGRNGAMFAVERVNAEGGIDGRLIELVVRDDKQDPVVAKREMESLLALKLPAVIGPMTSAMAMVIVPMANASDTILVSPTVTTTALSHIDDNFIRVISTTAEYSAKTADYQIRKLNHRKIATIYDENNKAYSESWLNDFRSALAAKGGQVVKAVAFNSAENASFIPPIVELLSAKPDSLAIIASATDAAMICQQVRKVNSKIPIVLSEWGATEHLIELGGNATEGVLMSQFLDRRGHVPRYEQFRKEYLQRFKQEPGFADHAGYDAAIVVIAGLRHDPEAKKLKQTLLSLGTFQGLQHEIKLDQFGDANRPTFITEIRNGRFLTLE